jgi:hypothetical protein
MLEWVPWIAAAIFAVLFFVFRAAMSNAVQKYTMLSEFIAIMFLEPEAYKNNRNVFKEWLNEQNLEDDHNGWMLLTKATEQIGTSFVAKLGPVNGLMALLKKAKEPTNPLG